MSKRYPGGFIFRSNPTIVGPTNYGAGLEGGSAPGVWTLEQASYYTKLATWPQAWQQRALYGWGMNANGELGQNNLINRSSPVQTGTLTDWLSVSIGTQALAVKTNNSLWTWGQNNNGMLGQGDTINRSSPVQVGALTNWAVTSAGTSSSSAALKTDGTLWTWGDDSQGILGLGTVNAHKSSPTQVGALTNWAKISAGHVHMMAIKTDGTLWGWGENSQGNIGTNNRINYSSPVQVGALSNWANVSAGNLSTVAVKTDGTIWAWGRNNKGQVGDSTVIARSSPVQIGALTNWSIPVSASNSTEGFTASIKTNGTLWMWGCNIDGQLGQNNLTDQTSPVQVGTLTNWASILFGTSRVAAIKTDGTLWGWGTNNDGALGLNNLVNRSSPTQVGALATWVSLGMKASSQLSINAPSLEKSNLFVAGDNSIGQLGQNDLFNRSSPVQVSSRTSWSYMAGSDTTTGIKSDGTLWACGSNVRGQLGQNDLISRSTMTQIGGDTNWSKVEANDQFTVATKSTGTLWAWGNNFYGQLGQDNTTYRSSPVQVGALTNWAKLGAGGGSTQFSMAIKTDGTLWSWGRNNYGQLGDNSIVNRSSPVQVGSATDWSEVATGGQFTIAIKTTGTLWSWGRSNNGQLGQNDLVDRSSPVQIGALTNWTKVTCAQQATFAIKTDGTLWSWGGQSLYGELGVGDTINRSSPVQVGALTSWSDIGSANNNGFAVKTDGTLWAWGDNGNGQLCQNNTVSRSSPVQVGSNTNWASVYDSQSSLIALTT